jgi:hypothetical protein
LAPLAMMIARVRTRSPSFRCTWKRAPSGAPPTHSSRTTWLGMTISAPNFCAWLNARAMSAIPVMPVGNPR